MPDLDTPITTTEQLQEQIDAAIGPRLQRERDKFADYDELKTFKANAATTLDQATARITELETEVSTLKGSLTGKDLELERTRVANEKKVPERWITGETREEMEKSADDWLADAKAAGKPGVNPHQGTGDPDAGISHYEVGLERGRARYQKKNT